MMYLISLATLIMIVNGSLKVNAATDNIEEWDFSVQVPNNKV